MTLAALAAAVNCRNLRASARSFDGRAWNLICTRDGKATDQAHCGLCTKRERLVQ